MCDIADSHKCLRRALARISELSQVYPNGGVYVYMDSKNKFHGSACTSFKKAEKEFNGLKPKEQSRGVLLPLTVDDVPLFI